MSNLKKTSKVSRESMKPLGLKRLNNSFKIKNSRTSEKTESRQNVDIMKNSPRKKPVSKLGSLSKLGMLPAHLSSSNSNLRKLELENTNLDLELDYNDYISSFAELVLEKKLLNKQEKSSELMLRDSQNQTKILRDKFHASTERIIDTQYLSMLSDSADNNLEDLTIFYEKLVEHKVPEILSSLNDLLERFNILLCKNIALPKDSNETSEFEELMLSCCNTLQEISDSKECDFLEIVKKNQESCHKHYEDVHKLRKILEKKIHVLQCKTLKACALSSGG